MAVTGNLQGGWKVTSNKNEHGKAVDDSKVLMKRPDGQPCNVQAMYVDHYINKGYELADVLDFDDVIQTPQPGPKKTKVAMRLEAYTKKAEAMTVKELMKLLDQREVPYSEKPVKSELVDLYVTLVDSDRAERMKPKNV